MMDAMMDVTQPLQGPLQGRCTLDGDLYKINGKEVVLMGGNYVVKAQPYYPPVEVVRANAKSMAAGAKAMAYTPPPAKDGTARPVVPCVRLAAMMEAAYPSPGTTVDPQFATQLEGVVKAFQEEGVYVFLDMHQDAFSTTNGGEGYPFWITEDFQTRAGCVLEQCCCCCCFSKSCCPCCPQSCQTPYITTPSLPLQPFFCLCNCLAKCFDLDYTTTDVVNDPEPWKAYSVGGDAGNPAWMNVGNANMRANNNDGRWGRIITSAQVQNSARRMYASAHNEADRKIFFEPFVALVKYLSTVWDKYDNVVAIELMNEPPIAGLPDLSYLFTFWGKILLFQADVLEELDKDPSITCPIAIANWTSAVEGESTSIKVLTCFVGTPKRALDRFKSWANQNRLIFSFHYYTPPATGPIEEVIQFAKKNAENLGGMPIFLSEYFQSGGAAEKAKVLAAVVDEGVNAVTYWHYCDLTYTGREGWFIYPPEIVGSQPLTTDNWPIYAPTVADGTFWGAYITGAGGGSDNVLELVPATTEESDELKPLKAGVKGKPRKPWWFIKKGVKPVWPWWFTFLHHGLKMEQTEAAEEAAE